MTLETKINQHETRGAAASRRERESETYLRRLAAGRTPSIKCRTRAGGGRSRRWWKQMISRWRTTETTGVAAATTPRDAAAAPESDSSADGVRDCVPSPAEPKFERLRACFAGAEKGCSSRGSLRTGADRRMARWTTWRHLTQGTQGEQFTAGMHRIFFRFLRQTS